MQPFHSASLGDFKLPVAGISSIEFIGEGDSNTARLTATNGDVIDVQLSTPTLHVQTGFGKTDLPVKMIRSIKVFSANQTFGSHLEGILNSVIQNPSFETPDVTGATPYFNFVTGITKDRQTH